MCAPIIPALTDHESEAILEAAREAGAVAASSILLRLPREVSPLFREWLEAEFPDRAARVMGVATYFLSAPGKKGNVNRRIPGTESDETTTGGSDRPPRGGTGGSSGGGATTGGD